jgi:tRNA (Thr-GGU) A37 N-methylase
LNATSALDPTARWRSTFSTRSADWAKPIGLHRVQVAGSRGCGCWCTGLKALVGTPVVEIKPVLDKTAER